MALDPRDRNPIPPREPMRSDAARADLARADAARAETRVDAVRAQARADAARAEAARAEAARAEAARDHLHVGPAPVYAPPRRRWPVLLFAALVGALVAGVMVSNYYSDRTIGQRLDSVVDKAGRTAERGAARLEQGAATVTQPGGVPVGEAVAQKFDDVSITAAVKTSLAADPALSALRIDVTTRDGVVALEGPAPDAHARERASVLAAAPKGVVRVDNRLVVEPSPR